jgi:hypothetical protein
MAVRYSIDKYRRLVLTKAEGCVTFDDVRGHQDRLMADPEFDVSFDQLIDTSLTTEVDISAEQARILAHRHIVSPASRRAIVAPRPLLFGMGRMMQAYHDMVTDTEVKVFYSMDEAVGWLGKGRGTARSGS